MKPKFVVNYSDSLGKYVYCPTHLGLEGDIDNDKEEVTFTYNIANHEFSEGTCSPDEAVDCFKILAKDNAKMADFIMGLHEDEGESFLHQIEFDDYPSDGDSLIRITINFNHPLLAKIKTELYDME